MPVHVGQNMLVWWHCAFVTVEASKAMPVYHSLHLHDVRLRTVCWTSCRCIQLLGVKAQFFREMSRRHKGYACPNFLLPLWVLPCSGYVSLALHC